jgi:DNA-binding GntR family transcriptional regulator
LLDAIAERNVNLAEQLSASHIKGTKEDLIEVFEITSHIIEDMQQQVGL